MEQKVITTYRNNAKYDEINHLIYQVLEPQLQAAVKHREDVEEEINEYQELSDQLTIIRNRYDDDFRIRKDSNVETVAPLEAMVDLGHQIAYCKAEIEDPQRVYVNVGMGFHVEFSLDEAIDFIALRIDFLLSHILPKTAERAKNIAADIEAALYALVEEKTERP
mmetsp:Transcript_11557/g.16591  ORF Transcript_11557/g.16591 Transcript_11557/m.16591 type:complete len:165 (-) Transcript_11557:1137-1631(-)